MKFLDNILFTEGETIKNVCSPLKHINITNFFFYRVYSDGTFIDFATNLDWTEFFLKKFYNCEYAANSISDLFFIENGISLWEMNPHNQIWRDGKNIFGAGNGITMVNSEQEAYLEIACFYARENDYYLNEYYLNNLDLLNNFILYFKDKASRLLKESEKNKLSFPKYYSKAVLPNQSISNQLNLNHVNNVDTFYSSLDIKNFYISSNNYLTFRDAECLYWLINGKTAKEIAIITNCSHRTVESRLESIKLKLNCSNKSSLIRIGVDLGIISYFDNYKG